MWSKFFKEKALLQLIFLNVFFHFGHFATLDTGYMNNTGIIKRNYNTEDIKLLKCTYLFACKNHLQFTKILIENQLRDITVVIAIITYGNAFVKKQIASLYFTEVVDIGSLWLLNIYTSTIGTYINYFKNVKIKKEKDSKIAEILKCHEYIYEKLDMESRDCDKSSRFYIGNMLFDDNQKKNYDYMLRIVSNNKRDIEVLIDDNNRILKIDFTKKLQAFKTNYLYLKRFGHYKSATLKLIDSFDLRIHWGDINKKFKDVYVNVDKLDWHITKLRPCLLLYSMIFNLLKVMMLRLTWKQFLYIKHQDAILIVDLTDQWLLSLQEFTSFLALEKDYVIESVIESISIHIKNYPLNNDGTVDLIKLPTYQNQFTDNLINNISNIISMLCEVLGCTIVENWNMEEILQTYNQVTFYPDRDLHNKSIDETTDSEEITDINDINNSISVLDFKQDFGCYFNYIIKGVDFNIIRSFIDYLETLNNYNLFDENSFHNFSNINICDDA